MTKTSTRYLFRSRNWNDGSTSFALQAIDQDRIYALRYEMCDDMARSPDLTNRDPRRKNELVPVAIQMDYKTGIKC